MYPTIIGLNVETSSLLGELMDSMAAPTATAAPLCWWDRPTNRKLSASALPRRCEPFMAARVQMYPHRVVDVMWMIPRPGDIEILL